MFRLALRRQTMDKARPGTWFTRGYLGEGVDDIQFDCCKNRFYCCIRSVRAFRHCPFCGCKLTNQRAIRPQGISRSMWKRTLVETITPTYAQQYPQKPYWVVEWLHDHGIGGSWNEYSRVFCRCDMTERQSALTELREAIADAKEDYPWCKEYFRLVYRTADRVIGVVERPNWFVPQFVSEETA